MSGTGPASDRAIAAVVPSRGAGTLERCLVTLATALATHPGGGRIVVVDDAAERPISLPERIADVPLELVRHASRRGFGPAVNSGVAAVDASWVAVVNDDVEIERGCLHALASVLGAADAFAACPAIEARERSGHAGGVERSIDESLYRLGWDRATLRTQPTPLGRTLEPHYPSGALALYDRARWVELGGYDEAFAPYYWEDVDLGLRARARGWRLVHVPEARARHSRHATVADEPRSRRRTIYRRNRELVLMRHLASPSKWALHWLALPARVLRGALGGDASHAVGLCWALARRAMSPRTDDTRRGILDGLFVIPSAPRSGG